MRFTAITKFLSWVVGAIASIKIPLSLRKALLIPAARLLGIDLSKAKVEVTEFDSLQALFTRELKDELLPPHQDNQDELLSPCCGQLSASGKIEAFSFLAVKGHFYSLNEFLGHEPHKNFEGGTFHYLYLAPHDYHRVHVPLAATLKQIISVPGTLLPVNPLGLALSKQLFAVNERLIFHFSTANGDYYLVMVGDLNVGQLRNYHNSKPLPLFLKGGEQLAVFNLGSTVVILCDKNLSAWLKPSGGKERKIWVGEKL